MRNVFARRTVISRSKRMERITNSIHVVEQFAQEAAPGLCSGECVVSDEIKTMGYVALSDDHQRVVAGAVVGFEKSEIREAITAIPVIALLVHVVGTERPVFVKRMLHAAGNVYCVRSFVVWVDVGGRTARGPSIDSLKRRRPSALG